MPSGVDWVTEAGSRGRHGLWTIRGTRVRESSVSLRPEVVRAGLDRNDDGVILQVIERDAG
jgi:hypothetical protein